MKRIWNEYWFEIMLGTFTVLIVGFLIFGKDGIIRVELGVNVQYREVKK